jgi:hypothetical protein
MITPLQAIEPLVNQIHQLRGLNRSTAQILADLHAQLRRQESICEDAAQVYADARYCKEQIIAQIRELERDGKEIGAA